MPPELKQKWMQLLLSSAFQRTLDIQLTLTIINIHLISIAPLQTEQLFFFHGLSALKYIIKTLYYILFLTYAQVN